MNSQEKKWIGNAIYDTFCGNLANNSCLVEEGLTLPIVYDFECPAFLELKRKYHLVQIAKNGTSFEKALRLMHYLAVRLNHASNFDNHITPNALALLEYSLNQKNHGINCLNKAKILSECCLALHIFARRVSLMPYSPYDFDNHVVVEIYDEKYRKWIMLDPTTNTYFVDDLRQPLGILEIRERAAKHLFLTAIKPNQFKKDLAKIFDSNLETNYYILKNMFYFYIDAYNGFGVKESRFIVTPTGFDVKTKTLMNLNYKIEAYQKQKMSPLIIEQLIRSKEEIENNILKISSSTMMKEKPF